MGQELPNTPLHRLCRNKTQPQHPEAPNYAKRLRDLESLECLGCLPSLLGPAKPKVEHRHPIVGRGVVRRPAGNHPQCLRGPVEFALCEKDPLEGQVRFDDFRVQAQGLRQVPLGLFHGTFDLQKVRENIVRIGMTGIDSPFSFQIGKSLREPRNLDRTAALGGQSMHCGLGKSP